MRNIFALLLCLVLLPMPALGETPSGIPAIQRVTLQKWETTQANKSVVRMWYPKTANPEIDEELRVLMDSYKDQLAGTLPKAYNTTSRNSRLDVDCRYSRTGTQWVSFLVTARVTVARKFQSTQLVSRTFDMETGKPIRLVDLFPPDSPAWELLAGEVRRQITAYFPKETPDEEQLSAWLDPSALEQADFTLHAMSLVLHYPAAMVYPKHNTLLEVTLMYPALAGMMTDEAAFQTDNGSHPMVALTYDDGPMRTPTTLLLNALREKGVRGTFFVLGNRIKANEDLVQRQHDEGHAVATHNYNHGNVAKTSAAQLRRQVAQCNAAMEAAIGLHPRYDRVPHGQYPPMIKAKAGWPLIQWSVDTYDWKGRQPQAILNNVKGQIEDGDIILCHDIKEKSSETAALLIGYLETDDFEAAVAGMAKREVNARWQNVTAPLFQKLAGKKADESMAPIPEVFHLD